MSYKTKKILRDAQGNPIPQIFNPDIDDFEPLYGQNGSQRVLLWGPNDEPLLTDTNPGKVEVTNTVNTQLTGSIVEDSNLIRVRGKAKRTITTILNAVSIAPGEIYPGIRMGLDGTESEVWLFVNIDQQPWTLFGNYIANVIGASPDTMYPKFANHNATYTSLNEPATCYFMGHIYNPTSMQDAKQYAFYASGVERFRIRNESDNIATATVRVIRIWR